MAGAAAVVAGDCCGRKRFWSVRKEVAKPPEGHRCSLCRVILAIMPPKQQLKELHVAVQGSADVQLGVLDHVQMIKGFFQKGIGFVRYSDSAFPNFPVAELGVHMIEGRGINTSEPEDARVLVLKVEGLI